MMSFINFPLPFRGRRRDSDSTFPSGVELPKCSATGLSTQVAVTPVGSCSRVSRAVVWFREGDLRLHDHPGLDAACELTNTALAPLLVCTPRTSEATLAAAVRLKTALAARGSHLFIRFSRDEAEAVINFLSEFAAERVHVRSDVETQTRDIVDRVRHAIKGTATVHTWVCDLRNWHSLSVDDLASMPDIYPQFLGWPARVKAQILPSSASENYSNAMLPAIGMDEDPPDTLQSVIHQVRTQTVAPPWNRRFPARYQNELELLNAIQLSPNVDTFGETILRQFLQRSEDYDNPDFARSLSEVLRQGALSPRRMREIVVEFERKNGRVLQSWYRGAAKTVLDVLEAREFHTLLARRDITLGLTVDGDHLPKFWRWNGFLIRYVEEGIHSPGAKNGTPPLLLVHGFGADSFHFAKSVRSLKQDYHVFAVDLIGFGRSEKPATRYTVATWEEMLWDFVREVIGKPVYVAGNSIGKLGATRSPIFSFQKLDVYHVVVLYYELLTPADLNDAVNHYYVGGYFACAFGTDAHNELCVGVCLINSAGRLQPEDPTLKESIGITTRALNALKKYRWSRLLVGRLLLRQLQGRVTKTLDAVYPVNPLEKDSKLPQNILRASFDYGAVEVIASGLITPSPRSLSELLKKYDGPVLVFNGMLDPLGDLNTRTLGLRQVYPKATIVAVEAG